MHERLETFHFAHPRICSPSSVHQKSLTARIPSAKGSGRNVSKSRGSGDSSAIGGGHGDWRGGTPGQKVAAAR